MVETPSGAGNTTQPAGTEAEPTAYVAIAAPAAGGEAFRELLSRLPTGTGVAFVVALPAGSGSSSAALVETLRSATRLPVEVATSGTRLRPDHVYVTGEDNLVAIAAGQLEVRPSPAGGAALAEAALRTTERRFGEAQQLAGVGVWEWNLDTGETWWSAVVYQLWGLPVAEPPPPLTERPIHPEDTEAYAAACERAREDGRLSVEWRVILPDGSIRWLAETGRMEKSGSGRRMLGVVQDISERKRTESRLTMLLGELQHRVRNILGVVRSVVARTVRTASSVDELAAALDGRLASLARTQGVFTRSHNSSVELEELVREELVAVAVREEQLTVDGPRVRLKREAAELMALALHELATNAVKYGALSEPAGGLSVTWRILDDQAGRRLSLEWREQGVRALSIRPARSGFGRELIERGLAYELGATTSLEFAPGGVRALIEAPLTDRIAEPEAATAAEETDG